MDAYNIPKYINDLGLGESETRNSHGYLKKTRPSPIAISIRLGTELAIWPAAQREGHKTAIFMVVRHRGDYVHDNQQDEECRRPYREEKPQRESLPSD